MASDYDVDINWDDDPFGGNMDFDMDFDMDPFKGKGFLRSFGTGFLSGLGHGVAGNSENRMRTMRTILPKTFTTGLDKVSFVNDRLKELAAEFKEENAESAKSLQNIAGKLNERMGSKLPQFVQNGMSNFSSKDFSSWEKSETRSDRFSARLDSTSEEDVGYAIDSSTTSQSSMFASLGETLNEMTAVSTSILASGIGAGNRQLINIESAMRDSLNYQRNIDARLQQAQLNVAARSYVQSSKFYKFMEAGVHAEVAELKKISKYSSMSDFEKTSMYTASKDYLRKKVFSTVGRRVGGITNLLKDRFSAENRTGAYSAIGSLIGNISDGMDMSEGVGLSKGMIGDIIGKMAADVAIDKLPHFFQRGPGKKAIDRMVKLYPEQAEYISDQIKKLTDMGNVFSYASTSGGGMLNYMAENYQSMDEMKYVDYDDYLANLPDGKKPLPKKTWAVLNAAGNRAKESINKLMSETTKSRGTQYSLKRRNPKDLNQPGVWKEINNITLNEVLPGLISKTNQILEQFRTGKDNIEQSSYNYMRGEFQTDSQKKVSVAADLMPHSEFRRFAQGALTLVDSIDPDKIISPSSRKSFAQVIAKDIDAGMSFNPYYYLGDINGVSGAAQKEIQAALKRYFGIKTEDVNRFNEGDSFQRMKQMSSMPTAQGRERLNAAGASADDLKKNFPNVAERIDLLRSTGNEQMLRDMGVIYTENGMDKVNMQAFHDRIGAYMDNPNNPELRDAAGGRNAKPDSTVKQNFKRSGTSSPTINSSFVDLNETLGVLNERLSGLSQSPQPNRTENTGTVNWDSITGSVTEIKESSKGILENTGLMKDTLLTMVELAKAGKLMTGNPGTKSEERKEETAKRSVLDRIKKMMPTGPISSSMEFLMSRNPIMLGGILGAIGSAATAGNPLLSATLAGAGLLGGMLVNKYNARNGGSANAEDPSDDEDILDESGEPLLKSAKLKAGHYFDAATKKVINTWKDIRGPIYDGITKTVIGARDLAGKIFGANGRAVVLNGLRNVRDKAVAGFNIIDPVGRINDIIGAGKNMIYQQDVYVKGGSKDPALRAGKFKSNEYYIRDESGNFKPISGWNEINGPVYDEQGNQLVSQEEYDAGLVTSSGMAVRGMGRLSASLVGGAAALGKSGLNALMGKLGYSHQASVKNNSAAGINHSPTGVERRLDKIYSMLSQHFGIPMEMDSLMGEATRSKSTGGSGGVRLNSLAWKEKEHEKEERHEVNEAIIKIAKNTEDMGGGEKEEEKGGFWGSIKNMMFGMAGFFSKLVKNPVGTIGGLIFGSLVNSTKRLATIGTALFSGVLGVASPLFKMMKWGFGKIVTGLVAKKGLDAASGLGGEIEQHGQSSKRKKKTKVKSKGRGSKIGRVLKGGALAYAGSMAIDAITGHDEEDFATGTEDLDAGERDPATGRYETWSDKAMDAVTSWLPQGQLAKSAVQGVLGPDGYKDLDNKGLFWTSKGNIFFDRKERDAAQAVIDGKSPIQSLPGADKANTQLSTQKKIRLAMYGVNDPTSNLARRIMALEAELYQYVIIRNGTSTLKPETPTDKIVENFANSGISKNNDKSALMTWFIGRFKPVFMTYNVAIAVSKMGDIIEFDNAKSYEVIDVVQKVQQTLANRNPPPYSIDPRIDDKEALMGPEGTRSTIAKLFEVLKKEFPEPKKTAASVIANGLETAKVNATNSDSKNPSTPQSIATATPQEAALLKASENNAITQLSNPSDVTTINISDLLPSDNKEMDAFTMVRLAVYGNIHSIPWRVEAVLKLERYVENFILITGNDAKFTGKSNQLMELFKAAFRLDNNYSKNSWSMWFRDRFLPTLMEYCKQTVKLRGGMPARTWKSLSDTNKAEIARKLTSLIVSTNDKQISVWNTDGSPFPNANCGIAPERADKYLKILDSKAQEAKLKDPELEKAKSEGNVPKDMANPSDDNVARIQRNSQAMMNSVYKTGSTGNAAGVIAGASGSSSATMSAGGYYPNATMSAEGGGAGSAGSFMGKADNSFNPEFIKTAGEDKGIKMSLKQGEQLMLNHLVKAGFRDNKTLALALAMAKKETGGYQNTVENTNWSAPTLLKYFKNIPDQATAQKVAAMSPPERAMWVYGRAPKGPSLGNSKPEDGFNYRGRGLFQLTGKANYEAFKKASGIDVVSNPRIVSEDPNVMAESAVWFLKNNKAMRSIAESGDFDTAVRGINGGNAVPATDERRGFYNEYLNRLRSGDLTLAGGTDDPAAQQGDAEAVNNQTPPVPEAADKNVPPTKITGTDTAVKPVTPGDTKALLAKATPSSPPAGSPPPPNMNASALPATPTGPVNGSTSSKTTAITSDTSDGVGSPQPTPTTPATQTPSSNQPVQKQTPAQSVGPAPGQGGMEEGMAKVAVKSLETLIDIRDFLKSNANSKNTPTVTM